VTAVDKLEIRITVVREGENVRLSGVDSRGRDVTFNLSRLVADRLGVKLIMLADVDTDIMGES
jgi:hypothetical protein